MRGATVSVSLNGAVRRDLELQRRRRRRAFGTFTKGGTTSFDSFRVRTDDPAFTAPVTPSASIGDATSCEGEPRARPPRR